MDKICSKYSESCEQEKRGCEGCYYYQKEKKEVKNEDIRYITLAR